MGYQIDFIGVGQEYHCDDAVLIRFGNMQGSRDEQTFILIDGGFNQGGQRIVDHIQLHYQTDSIDLVISSHADHPNGLDVVINSLRVKELWIDMSWDHDQALADEFHEGHNADDNISEKRNGTLIKAHALYTLATSKGIVVREPFSGSLDAESFLGALRALNARS